MKPEPRTPVDAAIRREVIEPGDSYIVQAPAGSGKTELLTQRFLRLLALVQRPQQVLAITFTRKATREMLDRILERLRQAASGIIPDEAHQRVAHELALAVLRRDKAQGWGLLENPAQLQIHTIDGLCARLASRSGDVPLPLSGLTVADYPAAHYAEAARITIDSAARAEAGDPCRTALEELLFRERGNANRLQELLAAELPRRDQWLGNMAGGPVDHASLLKERQRAELAELEQSLGSAELTVAAEAVSQLAVLSPDTAPQDPLLQAWTAQPGRPDANGAGQGYDSYLLWLWYALKSLASSSGSPYTSRSVNRYVFAGKDPERAPHVDTLKAVVDAWNGTPASKQAFARFVQYPPLDLGAGNETLLESMRQLLVMACAQLNVRFAEHGVCDFQHIAQQALLALGDESAPSDALLIEDGRLEHILIDEFQDTSQLQFSLVERLVEGWQPDDGRSLFLVGDPMQSIYSFRKADVSLFRQVEAQGRLGPVPLQVRRLEVNFRSRSELIETVNGACNTFFQAPSRASLGHVEYTAVAPFNGTGGEVHVCLELKEEEGDAQGAEAARIAQQVQARLRQDPQLTVGILTRKRKQLEPVARALDALGVPFEAVEVESLQSRPVIMDLLTITRALLHPGDRVAWLGLLLAPWCALQPAQLLAVAGSKGQADVLSCCLDEDRLAALDEDTAARVRRLGQVLSLQVRMATSLSLAERVEAAWVALGGPRVARRSQDMEDAQVFLQLLDRLSLEQPDNLASQLELRLQRLYAGSRAAAVQLMTIHKAKGLEFDAVFLPGLESRGAGDNSGLFRHRELSLRDGRRGALWAPLKPKGQALPSLFDYLGMLRREEQLSESQRLLYVAMTRARRYLYLSAVAEFKKDGDLAHVGGTFLGMLEHSMAPAIEELATGKSQQDPAQGPRATDFQPPAGASRPLIRLETCGAALDLPVAALPDPAVEPLTLGGPPPDRDRLALGQALHHWLELVHDHWDSEGEAHWTGDWYAERSAALRSSLFAAGARADSLAALQAELEALLCSLLQDPHMLNMLSPAGKRRSLAEAEYLVPGGGRLRQLIIDRLYQDDEGSWHVIDYKTGADEGATREKWRAQLDGYAQTVRAAEQGDVAEALILQAGPGRLIDPAADEE